MSAISREIVEINIEAKDATHLEKNMTLTQAVKIYPKAIGWSILLSTALVMEGYDLSLLGNFYAFPPFTERYGVVMPGSNPPSYQVM
jgi:MFS transporter, SP family, general alpha glucoside:H+ symporter